jgi:hypothetical protein
MMPQATACTAKDTIVGNFRPKCFMSGPAKKEPMTIDRERALPVEYTAYALRRIMIFLGKSHTKNYLEILY